MPLRVVRTVGHQAVKAADSNGLVLGPDTAHWRHGAQRWDKWMKHILKNGAQYLDIVTHHIYRDTPRKVFRSLESAFHWP